MRRIYRITAASLAIAMALALRVTSPASAASSLCQQQLPAGVGALTSVLSEVEAFALAAKNGAGIAYTGYGQALATVQHNVNQWNQTMMEACSLQSDVGNSSLSAANLQSLTNMSNQITALTAMLRTETSATHAQAVSTTANSIVNTAPSVNKSIQACQTASTNTNVHGATEATQVNGACSAVIAGQLQQANLLAATQAQQTQFALDNEQIMLGTPDWTLFNP